jgi:organic radical activating enzyme
MNNKSIVVEMYLFDTCTLKCGYCHLAESGKVLDNTQLRPFKDDAFIEKIATFFVSRSQVKWLLTLTGGEPLLMPNLPLFGKLFSTNENKLAFYTALIVGEEHPSFRWLLDYGAQCTEYIMASFHSEAESAESQFFEKLRLLKSAGHSVMFRFVGHPDRLERIDYLAEKCEKLNIAFYPTTLFSETYPKAYTVEQREKLSNHFTSLSQFIQLENGLDTTFLKCSAGSKLMSIDMRTGEITPCITVSSPVLGNIYENRLKLFDGLGECPKKGIACSCDIHFQQNIVSEVHDSANFEKLKLGYIPSVKDGLRLKRGEELRYFDGTSIIGQTKTASFPSLHSSVVKDIYENNKAFFENGYSQDNHFEFKSRQLNKFPQSK